MQPKYSKYSDKLKTILFTEGIESDLLKDCSIKIRIDHITHDKVGITVILGDKSGEILIEIASQENLHAGDTLTVFDITPIFRIEIK